MFRQLMVGCVMVAAVVSMAAQSKKGPMQSSPSLELIAKTDRHIYRMAEEIKMETQILNTSSEDVYIWGSDLCWNPGRGLSMYITAHGGSAVTGKVLLDCVPPPPREGSVYDFIKLEPDAFHGRVDIFKVNELINRPGEFDIHVEFRSFLSDSFIKEYFARDPISKLPLWTMEKPTIVAPPTHVVINP